MSHDDPTASPLGLSIRCVHAGEAMDAQGGSAPSRGGVESLVTQPITTTHHGLTPEERARRGIADGMVRLSCGLEDPDDQCADLERALG